MPRGGWTTARRDGARAAIRPAVAPTDPARRRRRPDRERRAHRHDAVPAGRRVRLHDRALIRVPARSHAIEPDDHVLNLLQVRLHAEQRDRLYLVRVVLEPTLGEFLHLGVGRLVEVCACGGERTARGEGIRKQGQQHCQTQYHDRRLPSSLLGVCQGTHHFSRILAIGPGPTPFTARTCNQVFLRSPCFLMLNQAFDVLFHRELLCFLCSRT